MGRQPIQEWVRPPFARDNNTVSLFDWIGRRSRRSPEPPAAWTVYPDGGDIVAEDGRGGVFRASFGGARSVRIIPLTGGKQHAELRGGWQVALAHAEGDALLGKPHADWGVACELAGLVCGWAELPFVGLVVRVFSRVGQCASGPVSCRQRWLAEWLAGGYLLAGTSCSRANTNRSHPSGF